MKPQRHLDEVRFRDQTGGLGFVEYEQALLKMLKRVVRTLRLLIAS
jgi:hypothetical protein